MNPCAALFQELCNRRIVPCRLQQFDARFADRQHRHPHALFAHFFYIGDFESQRIAPKAERFVQLSGRNPNVFKLHKAVVRRQKSGDRINARVMGIISMKIIIAASVLVFILTSDS
jgi:hypothetical protein